MRDGINDYELLRMLEDKKPYLVYTLSSKIVKTFDSYEQDISTFRQARRELLESLSKAKSGKHKVATATL